MTDELVTKEQFDEFAKTVLSKFDLLSAKEEEEPKPEEEKQEEEPKEEPKEETTEEDKQGGLEERVAAIEEMLNEMKSKLYPEEVAEGETQKEGGQAGTGEPAPAKTEPAVQADTGINVTGKPEDEAETDTVKLSLDKLTKQVAEIKKSVSSFKKSETPRTDSGDSYVNKNTETKEIALDVAKGKKTMTVKDFVDLEKENYSKGLEQVFR